MLLFSYDLIMFNCLDLKMDRVEVLIIGDELLDGRVADTNTLHLANVLLQYGLKIVQRTTVLDIIEQIKDQCSSICERKTKYCFVSGGLGPTSDDLTSEALASFANVELYRDQIQEDIIVNRLKKSNKDITPNQLKQADRPAGSTLIRNEWGTAPGFLIEVKGCTFISLPGVPVEFKNLLEQVVQNNLNFIDDPISIKLLRCFGLYEAQVDDYIKEFHEKFSNVQLGFRAKFPEINITLSSTSIYKNDLDKANEFCLNILKDYIFSFKEGPFAENLVKELSLRNGKLAVAESCTGGLIGSLITNVDGSSKVFTGGILAYSNDIKIKYLSVSNNTIEKFGAVSEETTTEMVNGVINNLNVDYAIAISGIAGPTGGTEEKPVGTIWISIATPEKVVSKKLMLKFDRERNKAIAAHYAIDLLRKSLS
jgi:nicotinamide-nucleotide amidase